MPFTHGDLHLSRKARLQILLRRIETAEAVVDLVSHFHEDGDVDRCLACRQFARWREARAVHEATGNPKPLARAKKQEEYATAVAARIEAADAIVDVEARRHWGRCDVSCRACSLLEEWRDAQFVHEAVSAYTAQSA